MRGLADTLGVMRQIAAAMKKAENPPAFLHLVGLTMDEPVNLEGIIVRLRAAQPIAKDLLRLLQWARNRSTRLLGTTSRQASRGLECGHR